MCQTSRCDKSLAMLDWQQQHHTGRMKVPNVTKGVPAGLMLLGAVSLAQGRRGPR